MLKALNIRRRSRYRSAYRARRRRNARADLLRRVLIVVCAAVFLYCGIRLIVWRSNVRDTDAVNESLQSMHQAAMDAETAPLPQEDQTDAAAGELPADIPDAIPEPTAIPAAEATAAPAPVWPLEEYQYIGTEPEGGMAELAESNADLVGWLQIDEVVNLPVVYRDNEYYLTHDFYGREKNSGTLFLDVGHPFTARTQHLLIHGHNMYDGSMFGQLVQYRKKDFARSHGVIYFQTLYRQEVYLLVAAAITPSDPTDPEFIPFLGTPVFPSARALQNYIDLLDERGLYHFPIDVDMSDALLTMSTCVGDGRLILFCRRVRVGETKESILEQLNR